jgi:hypothetical protein
MKGAANYAYWLIANYHMAVLMFYSSSPSKSGRYLAASPNAKMPAEKMPIEMES